MGGQSTSFHILPQPGFVNRIAGQRLIASDSSCANSVGQASVLLCFPLCPTDSAVIRRCPTVEIKNLSALRVSLFLYSQLSTTQHNQLQTRTSSKRKRTLAASWTLSYLLSLPPSCRRKSIRTAQYHLTHKEKRSRAGPTELIFAIVVAFTFDSCYPPSYQVGPGSTALQTSVARNYNPDNVLFRIGKTKICRPIMQKSSENLKEQPEVKLGQLHFSNEEAGKQALVEAQAHASYWQSDLNLNRMANWKYLLDVLAFLYAKYDAVDDQTFKEWGEYRPHQEKYHILWIFQSTQEKA
ncbi:hypothetical protein EV360DRAFT_74469 [Lentinula raphanica]|nr:hypothetical protein EV360DRAFT_74469 [Lentinula raphanica]